MEEVRMLYAQRSAVDEISRFAGHNILTINNYLKEDCPTSNGHYDCRRPGKLAPYEQTVIEMRAKGITYNKMHEYKYILTSLHVTPEYYWSRVTIGPAKMPSDGSPVRAARATS